MSDTTTETPVAAPSVESTPAAAAEATPAAAAAESSSSTTTAAAQPAAATTEEEEKVEEADSTAEYQALVQLKPVEVLTGEEDDEVLYKQSVEQLSPNNQPKTKKISTYHHARANEADSDMTY